MFLPSAGEPMDVLASTFHHVSRLDWAGELAVLVLDDSARDEVAALARAHGFTYLTHPDRGRLKKAGNLRFGFDHSRGDLVAVFDADFVPRPDHLAHLAPYADEADGGIVQSPQFCQTREAGTRWLQRSALERSGGFAQIGHSEDVHTGVNLMKIGYQVRYVPILGSRGICPDSMMGSSTSSTAGARGRCRCWPTPPSIRPST